jgi:hypothetical protein
MNLNLFNYRPGNDLEAVAAGSTPDCHSFLLSQPFSFLPWEIDVLLVTKTAATVHILFNCVLSCQSVQYILLYHKIIYILV